MTCPMDPWIAASCGLSGVTPDPDGVRNFQCAALRRTLRRAAEQSAFYRERFAVLPAPIRQAMARGEWPRCPESLSEDMALLPFTLPADLAETPVGETAPAALDAEGSEGGWRRLLCVSQDEVARMVTLHTSGTTGALPGGAGGVKRLAFSEHDLARTVDFFAIGMGVIARPGDAVLVLLPGAERPGGVADLLIRALARLGMGCQGSPFLPLRHVPVCQGYPGDSAADPAGFAAELRALRPDCVVAAPSQLRRLIAADEVNQLAACGSDGRGGVRAVLSSVEPLPDDLRGALSRAWQCEVFDHYGLTESGYGGGVECSAHHGYHWREADIWLEIVDPVSGVPLPEGAVGEVVITTPDRRAMPLIRYRTGDVAAFLPGPCRCGSPLRRLGPVRGRLLPDENGVLHLATPQKGKAHARSVSDNS